MNEKPQVATLPNPEKSTKFNRLHRREQNGFMEEISILVPPAEWQRIYKEWRSVVTLRIYGTSARNYACLWTHGDAPEHCRNGSGVAGGYGYHRPSAAAQEAINNAGFVLSKPIDGVGDQAMREALFAVAAAIGFPDALMHRAHA